MISESGHLKIADFGLARVFSTDEGRQYSHQVATRYVIWEGYVTQNIKVCSCQKILSCRGAKSKYLKICGSTVRSNQRSKLTLCYVLNGWSFRLILGQTFFPFFFQIGHCVHEVWQFHWGCHYRLVKSWFWEKGSQNLEIWTKYWYFGNSEVHFYMKTPNPLSDLKIKYWRFDPQYVKSQKRLWDYILRYFDFASP